MMSGCLSDSLKRGAIARMVMSTGPPAGYGTTMRTGLTGYAGFAVLASAPAAMVATDMSDVASSDVTDRAITSNLPGIRTGQGLPDFSSCKRVTSDECQRFLCAAVRISAR